MAPADGNRIVSMWNTRDTRDRITPAQTSQHPKMGTGLCQDVRGHASTAWRRASGEVAAPAARWRPPGAPSPRCARSRPALSWPRGATRAARAPSRVGGDFCAACRRGRSPLPPNAHRRPPFRPPRGSSRASATAAAPERCVRGRETPRRTLRGGAPAAAHPRPLFAAASSPKRRPQALAPRDPPSSPLPLLVDTTPSSLPALPCGAQAARAPAHAPLCDARAPTTSPGCSPGCRKCGATGTISRQEEKL